MTLSLGLGVYSPGVYNLGPPILDPLTHSLGLGVYSLGVCTLGPPILEPLTHSPVL